MSYVLQNDIDPIEHFFSFSTFPAQELSTGSEKLSGLNYIKINVRQPLDNHNAQNDFNSESQLSLAQSKKEEKKQSCCITLYFRRSSSFHSIVLSKDLCINGRNSPKISFFEITRQGGLQLHPGVGQGWIFWTKMSQKSYFCTYGSLTLFNV